MPLRGIGADHLVQHDGVGTIGQVPVRIGALSEPFAGGYDRQRYRDGPYPSKRLETDSPYTLVLVDDRQK